MNVFFNLEPATSGELGLDQLNVAVLYGGRSSEAEISCVTGQAVCDALRECSLAGRGPKSVHAIELDREVRWKIRDQDGGLQTFLDRLAGIDICFLALHGGDGEDGHAQGLLAAAGVTFTGSSLEAASASMDKQLSRLVAESAGLSLAEGILINRDRWNAEEEHAFLPLLQRCPGGVCVKPRRGGSSVGVIRGRERNEIAEAVLAILEQGDDALIEAWTEGIEVACGVLGNRAGDPRALMPVEVRPHAGRFFDYDEKYSDGGAQEFCPPIGVDPQTCAVIQQRALAIHRALGCDGYSRSDFIVPSNSAVCSTSSSEPVFLELNSLPGLTPRSLLPLAAAEAGLDFRSLCLGILAAGLQKDELHR